MDWEDPTEEGMTTHSSIPAWRIPMDRGAWWVTVHGVAKLDTTEWLKHNYTLIKLKVLAQAVVVFKWGTHFMLCFFFLVFEYFSNFS